MVSLNLDPLAQGTLVLTWGQWELVVVQTLEPLPDAWTEEPVAEYAFVEVLGGQREIEIPLAAVAVLVDAFVAGGDAHYQEKMLVVGEVDEEVLPT